MDPEYVTLGLWLIIGAKIRKIIVVSFLFAIKQSAHSIV
jgi:hypothetical protein